MSRPDDRTGAHNIVSAVRRDPALRHEPGSIGAILAAAYALEPHPLDYVSTRGAAPVLGFADVLLAGLARDGGLYVPERWPALEPPASSDAITRPYAEVAFEVMWPYVAGSIEPDDFARIVADTYSTPAAPGPSGATTFAADDVVPLRDLGDGVHLMELFHGPTLAFKDVALQLVGRLFDHELSRRGERVLIVGATSGDTGSAAIEACRDRDAIDIVIMHPAGRVSDVQRRQMTTVASANVHNVAIEGTFDDCQDLVKALFADEALRDELHLSAVNSINWARVMAQIVYYIVAAERLGRRRGGRIAFSVPTGNFGNVFAGYAAQAMGLPVSQFVVASNRNDILTQFFTSGSMTIGDVHPTLSPSMDIQVSSNLERLLFELYGRDGAVVAELMARFRVEGHAAVDPVHLQRLRRHWSGARIDDEETVATIKATYERTGVLVDPHTAVGLAAVPRCRRDPADPMVVLATAHPAKFPDAVERATGVHPALPPHLADLFDRPERYRTLPNDLDVVKSFVRAAARR
jgi:threonine synthase